jgi:FKBP-type peptidyl-prolyl cis-trans isomerase (trigger factor)
VMSEIENLKKRSEQQVRASLILENIASQEKIELKPEEYETELKTLAVSMKVEEEKLKEFYAKNPGRMDDFTFRVRQERTLKFLLDKAKLKSKG